MAVNIVGKTQEKNKKKRKENHLILVSLLGGIIHAISDGNAFQIAGWKSSSLTSPYKHANSASKSWWIIPCFWGVVKDV